MEATAFAEITRSVIAKQGFDGFLPVACFPERREIRALEGVPPSESPEEATLQWASSIADGNEEFLIAFKCSETEFKIIRCLGSEREHHVFGAQS